MLETQDDLVVSHAREQSGGGRRPARHGVHGRGRSQPAPKLCYTMQKEKGLALESNNEPSGHSLDMVDADVILFPTFFPPADADTLLAALSANIAWQHTPIKLYGREIYQPRLTAWYGDPGRSYTYSGITMHPEPWTPELLQIRHKVESVAGVVFNSVLLNQYRHERDSVAWHSDDETELGTDPVIASVSFGATRRFQFKHKTDPTLRAAVDLTHGSLLLMRGPTQHFWKHQIPKSTRPHASRINLTFRTIR
jgi:alkylated DNA repair dioxygenase AlkB